MGEKGESGNTIRRRERRNGGEKKDMGGKEKTGKQKVKRWGKSFRKYRKQAGKVGQSLVEKETATSRKHDDCRRKA